MILLLLYFHWGCFGFDSIHNLEVSTPSVVTPARKSRNTSHNWQQQLCTRCVIKPSLIA